MKGQTTMALVTTIDNGYQLGELFKECGRGDQFSYSGFDALYNYLDDLSDDIGEDFKVDVIALCCDFTEYESYEDLYNEYSYSYNEESESWDDINQNDFIEWLNDNTTVIEAYNYNDNLVGIIIQAF